MMKGGIMLDGAVGGLPKMVAERTAVYFISGEKTAFEKVSDILGRLSDRVFFMGTSVMRLRRNYAQIVTINIAPACCRMLIRVS